jgi:hypothetical protein
MVLMTGYYRHMIGMAKTTFTAVGAVLFGGKRSIIQWPGSHASTSVRIGQNRDRRFFRDLYSRHKAFGHMQIALIWTKRIERAQL